MSAGGKVTTTKGTIVTFAGTATGGTSPYTESWNFGDGTTATGSLTPTHTYADYGTYTAFLYVTDSAGNTASSTATITVANIAPTVTISGPATGNTNTPIRFGASVRDPSPLDQISAMTYQWNYGDGTTATGTDPAPTHTFTSAGNYTVSVSATDIDGATSVLATTTIAIAAATVIPIDSTWLQNNGPAPYYLMQAGATYQLQTDVTVTGTAFIVLNKNMTLDLNGHTITYDNSVPITVTNGGFETGDTTGWNVSQAPGAYVTAARTGMWGNWMLEVPNVAGGATASITSSAISIPAANVEYAAEITPKTSVSGGTVIISVVDTVTGATLASGSSLDPASGYAAVVQFTPTTTDPVKLMISMTSPSGQQMTTDLDYAALTYSRNWGVVASDASQSYWPANLWTSTVSSNNRNVANIAIKNGTIVQGQGHSYAGTSINGMAEVGLTVNGVSATASGDDTNIIDRTWGVNTEVTNCTLTGNGTRISNRKLFFGAIYLVNCYGTIYIAGNTITGSMHVPIVIYRAVVDNSRTEILNNQISQNTLGTDGYGIVANNLENFEIAYNTIKPVNGRGILFDGINGSITRNGTIHDNTVSAIEHPDLEYAADAMEATALRMRNYSPSYFANLVFTNNTFSATTGPGDDWAAIGARINFVNTNGSMNNAGIVFRNNKFRAILTAPIPGLTGLQQGGRAWGFSSARADAGTNTLFVGNTFDSNCISLNFGDSDGYGYSENDLMFVGNTISKSSSGASLTYYGIVAGDWKCSVSNIRMFDTQYANGATPGVLFLGIQPKQIAFGYELTVSVVDANGNRVGGAAVTITDQNGNLVYAGVTNNQGLISSLPIVTTSYSVAANGDDSNPIITSTPGFTIRARTASKTGSQTINLQSDLTSTVQIS